MKLLTLPIVSLAVGSMANPIVRARADYCVFQCSSTEVYEINRLREENSLINYTAGCKITNRTFYQPSKEGGVINEGV